MEKIIKNKQQEYILILMGDIKRHLDH